MTRTFRAAILGVLAIFTASASLLAVPVISGVQIGNVTTTHCDVCWEVSESADPWLEVFSDAAGTQSLASQVRIEVQSLRENERVVGSTYEQRGAGRVLKTKMNAKRIALVRVSGLQPDQTRYVRPIARDENGVTVASGSLTPVKTASISVFVNESRQLLVDLSPLQPSVGEVAGALVLVSSASSRYPLIAVVGDSFSPTIAYLDLTHLLDASGQTNLTPSGQLQFSLSWKGLPQSQGAFDSTARNYTGAPTVASYATSTFIPSIVNLVATSSVTDAVVGLPFWLNISAVDGVGQLALGFARPVLIESPTLLTGAGVTPPISNGVLSPQALIFGTPGVQTVTVRDSTSGANPTTLEVTVGAMTYANWRKYHFGNSGDPRGNGNADPDFDGAVNYQEFLYASNPVSGGSRGGLALWKNGSALTAHFDLNRHQLEQTAHVEVSADLTRWFESAKTPVPIQTFADRWVMEVSFTLGELAAATGSVTPGDRYFVRLKSGAAYTLLPNSGRPGSVVTIAGPNLGAATSVRFARNFAATFTINSNSIITATVPQGAETGPIEIATPAGILTTEPFGILPRIAAFTPNAGPVGTEIIVTGDHLAGTTAVKFANGVAATFTVTSDTELRVIVPIGAVRGTIRGETPGGATTSLNRFTVTP
jgi:hypothetical protein